jgi:NAD(P)-dependent dehydrogenase (short-subunit alcohol dehydrogenase family)
MSNWSVADVPRLDGQTVVVTGANSGIGFEATRVFAQQGATVVMACRSTDRATDAKREVLADNPTGDLHVRKCDLADLTSVAAFAEGVHEEFDSLDVLCNNAGVMAIPRQETADGFEMQFGVNHLGHFALTGHLLDLLQASDSESRVVTQSSGMHERGEIDFDDLHGEHAYDKWDAYGQSKLANVCFAYELQRRLDAAGVNDVTSVACHPGWAATNLQVRTGQESGSGLVLGAMKLANKLFAQSAASGALPIVYAAVEPRVSGGSYVGPGGLLNMRGAPEIQRSSDRSYDESVAERLWEASEELTGVTYDALGDATQS